MSIRTPHLGASRTGLAALGMLLAGMLLAPSLALAHAELDTVTPADKSTVQGSPTEIVMTFVQNLDPAKSSIAIVDAANKVVAKGGTVPAGKPREMDLALTTPLDPGAYSIRWTTFSTEDGELAHGVTTFTVAAAPSPSPTPATSAAPPSAAPSVAPSVAPSLAPTAAPSSPPMAPASSTSDALIPIVVVLIILAALGTWLLRSRARGR